MGEPDGRTSPSLGDWNSPTQVGVDTGLTPRPQIFASSYLLVVEGETSRAFRLPVVGDVVIGRAKEVDLRLKDNSVSRQHARITIKDGQLRVADLDSQNGTFVNGERISGSQLLLSGDVIGILDVSMVVHAEGRAPVSRQILDLAGGRMRVDEELERAKRFRRSLGVVALQFGGRADRPRVARALANHLRVVDVVAWAGEDEAFVIMPEADALDASDGARRLLQAVAETAPAVRAGVATFPSDGCEVDVLIGAARGAAVDTPAGQVGAATETFSVRQIGESSVVVADPAMRRVYQLLDKVARSDLSVLITGETGTGKELAAAAIHHGSARAGKPLVTLNCASVHEQLVESELFGHQKGAFTGAVSAKPGLLEVAEGGTVFLDEVGELPPSVQAKLLRVLETRKVMRLGDVRERAIDMRIVGATNRDLEAEVAAGNFRQDLYFRLSAARVWLPPLRDRKRELPILASRFLAEACEQHQRGKMAISSQAMQRLLTYRWPGNVRELRNLMDYVAVAHESSVLEPWHLDERLGPGQVSTEPASPATFRPIDEEIRELESARMGAALRATGGNQTRAAELIRMPLRTFQSKVKQYRLSARKE
jgi:DNA-binding NtrC family response regulator